jgi:hypothetical protein
MMHANDRDGEQDVLHVLRAAKEDAGPRQAFWLYQIFYAIMSPESCQRLQEIIMMHPDAYLPKTEFDIQQFNRGKQEGLREAILTACELLGIEVPAERLARLEGMQPAELKQLLLRVKQERAWPSG